MSAIGLEEHAVVPKRHSVWSRPPGVEKITGRLTGHLTHVCCPR